MKKPQTIENTWHPISKTSAERQFSISLLDSLENDLRGRETDFIKLWCN